MQCGYSVRFSDFLVHYQRQLKFPNIFFHLPRHTMAEGEREENDYKLHEEHEDDEKRH